MILFAFSTGKRLDFVHRSGVFFLQTLLWILCATVCGTEPYFNVEVRVQGFLPLPSPGCSLEPFLHSSDLCSLEHIVSLASQPLKSLLSLPVLQVMDAWRPAIRYPQLHKARSCTLKDTLQHAGAAQPGKRQGSIQSKRVAIRKLDFMLAILQGKQHCWLASCAAWVLFLQYFSLWSVPNKGGKIKESKEHGDT